MIFLDNLDIYDKLYNTLHGCQDILSSSPLIIFVLFLIIFSVSEPT